MDVFAIDVLVSEVFIMTLDSCQSNKLDSVFLGKKSFEYLFIFHNSGEVLSLEELSTVIYNMLMAQFLVQITFKQGFTMNFS